MKMTKKGSSQAYGSGRCQYCGAEYEVDKAEFESLMYAVRDCTWCNTKNGVHLSQNFTFINEGLNDR